MKESCLKWAWLTKGVGHSNLSLHSYLRGWQLWYIEALVTHSGAVYCVWLFEPLLWCQTGIATRILCALWLRYKIGAIFWFSRAHYAQVNKDYPDDDDRCEGITYVAVFPFPCRLLRHVGMHSSSKIDLSEPNSLNGAPSCSGYHRSHTITLAFA